MREPIDHEVKLRLRGSEWLALRRLADDDDRTLSGYIRRVLMSHLDSVSALERASDRADAGHDTPNEGHRDYPRAVAGGNT